MSAALAMLDTPPNEWDGRLATLDRPARLALANELSALAQRAAFASQFVESLTLGAGLATAEMTAGVTLRNVRKALGFSKP